MILTSFIREVVATCTSAFRTSKRLFLLVAVLSSTASASTYKTMNIATLDFTSSGLEQGQAEMISDKFRATLVEETSYRIMERSAMNDVLKEQGFQQTGACNTSSCLVEAGQLLGVTYIIMGRISSAAGVLALSVRIVDVGTGEIVIAKSVEYQCSFFEMLTQHVPSFARSFAQVIASSAKKLATEKRSALLHITSDPMPGRVIIDGTNTGESTPVTVRDIAEGQHSIEVISQTMSATTNVMVKSGQLQKVSIELQPCKSSLRVQCNIPAVQVHVIGHGVHLAPFQLDTLPCGNIGLVATKEGYFPDTQSVSIVCGAVKEHEIRLVPISYARILSLNDSGVLTVNGEVHKGKILALPHGYHDIEWHQEGFQPYSRRIQTSSSDTVNIEVPHVPLSARLAIVSTPSQATVSLNGDTVGTTPLQLSLTPDTMYSILVRHRMFEPYSKVISATPGTNYTVDHVFKVESEEYKAWKQKKTTLKYMNLLLAGSGRVALRKSPAAAVQLAFGLISDAVSVYAGAKSISHATKATAAKHPIEQNYFKERYREDLTVLGFAVSTSLVLRIISVVKTSKEKF